MRNIVSPGSQNPAVVAVFIETEKAVFPPALLSLNELELMVPERRERMRDMDFDFRLFR